VESLSHSRRDLIFACGHHHCINSRVFCVSFDPTVVPVPLILDPPLSSLYLPAVENPPGGHEPELPLPNTSNIFKISSQLQTSLLAVHLACLFKFPQHLKYFFWPFQHRAQTSASYAHRQAALFSPLNSGLAYSSRMTITSVSNVRSVGHTP
jgi:hypothetical protein